MSPTPPRPELPRFEYEPILEFPLLWRWTRSTHDLLAPDELASIWPLGDGSARVASDHARALRGFADRATHRVFQLAGGNDPDLSEWLKRLPVPIDEHVVLSWNPALAVETVWPLFIGRWSAFWYASSDDLEVFPPSGGWLLQLAHFGRCSWVATPVR